MMQYEEQHLSVRNATRAAAGWAASNVGRLVRVEVLVTLSCALLAMLVFLGSGRRYSRSVGFRAVVWSALMLSYPAVSYTIGLMQSASFHNELMVVWACFLLACADGIAACNIDDSDQQARLLLNQAAQSIYVFLLLLSYAGSLRLELKILLFLFWVLTVARLGLRLQRLLSAGRDRVLTVDNGLITKYMADEYERSGWQQHADSGGKRPMSVESYKYVVTGEENLQDELGEYKLMATDDIVTLDMVVQWFGDGRQHHAELLSLCISFALFKLLRRRLTGSPQYELHERVVDKVRCFYHALIFEGRRGGLDMFHVIEAELGFLFDFFYSRYPSHKQSLIPETILFTTAIALSMSSLFSSTLMHYGTSDSVIISTRFDIWLARLVISLFLVLETFQYLSLVLSDWHRLKLFCRYIVQNHSRLKRGVLASMLLRMCSLRMTRRYWSNTVGQYSLLHACIQSENNSCFSSRQYLPEWIRWFLVRTSMTTHRHLPESVKEVITYELENFLRNSNAEHPGTYSYYDPGRYFWGAYGRPIRIPVVKPTIRNILILHIATTICCQKPPGEEQEEEVFGVVTTLSAYCAYLVCHAPELITPNIYEARLLLEGVQRRARQWLKDCRSENDMYIKLASFKPTKEEDEYEAVVAQGVSLSNLLTSKVPDDAERWHLLAQLWVKFLLSNVAPSNNAAAHIKRLASGGEFITHLWAFMTQGGFVKQPWVPCGDDKSEDTQQDLEAGAQHRKKEDIDAWMEMLERLGDE